MNLLNGGIMAQMIIVIVQTQLRCGMPINPLLKESSYGCKILCGKSSSSYEMRKIKDIQNGNLCLIKKNHSMMNFKKIKQMSKIAGIPKIIVDEALRQHKKLSVRHLGDAIKKWYNCGFYLYSK